MENKIQFSLKMDCCSIRNVNSSPKLFGSLPRYDFIEIRDGDNENADLLGKHCGNIAPPTITSSGPSVYIKFTSDYARQGAGFSLRYEIYK
ncbi:hypothetical protein L345_16823, partial [Ophiophagus hannah]